jgi:hypothetical protein
VGYLQQVATAGNELLTIEMQRYNLSKNPGDLQANQNEAALFQSRLNDAKDTWKSNMTQDDAQIDMLMQMQSILSRRAMGGSPNIMGTVVNAAVLAGALQ